MDRDDALRVLFVLTSAYPQYPMPEGTTELYIAALTTRMPDPGIAFAVASDWTGSQLWFPKIAEFIEAYGAEAYRREKSARQRAIAQQHYRPGTVACRACEDRGMEEWEAEGYFWSAPCSQCRPDERSYWREGHFDVGHDVRGCEHPRCEERSRGRRKAKA